MKEYPINGNNGDGFETNGRITTISTEMGNIKNSASKCFN